MKTPASAKLYLALIMALGLWVLGYAIANAHAISIVRFAAFLLVAVLAARLTVKLPGITGTMSVNLPFILVAVAEMSLAEALLVGCTSNLVQCLPRGGKKFNALRAAFNFCVMALAIWATRWVYNWPALAGYVGSASLSSTALSGTTSVRFTIIYPYLRLSRQYALISTTWRSCAPTATE